MPPRRALTLAFLALVALYALFQARFLILGPRISIEEPRDGSTLATSTVTIAGTARNIASISLDGDPIQIDTSGRFSEKLLLSPGPSIIEMQASDRFGRTTEKEVRVVVSQ